MRIAFVALLLSWGGRAAVAQASQPLVEATASVSARDSGSVRELVLRSQRFLITPWYQRGDTGPKHVVLQETSEQHCCREAERETYGTITVAAWRDSIAGNTAPLWRETVTADEGEIWGEFYRTTVLGCCDTDNEQTYFNLLTGGPLFRTTVLRDVGGRSLRILTVPNSSLRRVIAFQDGWTPTAPPEARSDQSVVGVLQYGSPSTTPARLFISQVAGSKTDYRLADIRFVIKGKPETTDESVLWSANKQEQPASLTGFAVQIRLAVYGDTRPDAIITIPVVRDTLDIANAVGPRTLRLGRSTLRLTTP